MVTTYDAGTALNLLQLTSYVDDLAVAEAQGVEVVEGCGPRDEYGGDELAQEVDEEQGYICRRPRLQVHRGPL